MAQKTLLDAPKKKGKKKTAQEANAEYNGRVKEAAEQEGIMGQIANVANIRKVKFVKGAKDSRKVTIGYSFIENNHVSKHSIESDDQPSQSFVDALAGLAPHVAKLLYHLSDERKRQVAQMVIKGASFNVVKDVPHAVVTVTIYLPSGKATTINTPNMAMESESPSDNALDKEMVDALEKVIAEAKDYIRGKRSQRQLPFNGNQGEAVEDAENIEEPEGE